MDVLWTRHGRFLCMSWMMSWMHHGRILGFNPNNGHVMDVRNSVGYLAKIHDVQSTTHLFKCPISSTVSYTLHFILHITLMLKTLFLHFLKV